MRASQTAFRANRSCRFGTEPASPASAALAPPLVGKHHAGAQCSFDEMHNAAPGETRTCRRTHLPSVKHRTLSVVDRTSRNSPCPCGSGRKYKRCCLPGEPRKAPDSLLRPIETIDATGRDCRWTVYARADRSGSVVGELVEHACDGERFEVDRRCGWLHNDKPASMFSVLEALPPQLNGWALRTAIEAMSDEDLTPLGIEVARVFMLASAVNEAAREDAPTKLARIRRMARRHRMAA